MAASTTLWVLLFFNRMLTRGLNALMAADCKIKTHKHQFANYDKKRTEEESTKENVYTLFGIFWWCNKRKSVSLQVV